MFGLRGFRLFELLRDLALSKGVFRAQQVALGAGRTNRLIYTK